VSGFVRRAYVWACALDVATRKPGNVSLASPGHGMDADQFLLSASVSADALCERGARVGARIEAAIRATHAAVACNTNLGIVLLCAPIAAAFGAGPPGVASLRDALGGVLARLDVEDARACYRAIALANPGGLGAAAQQDVHDTPSIDLRAAMQLAAARDRIALQYASGFAEVFDLGLLAFERYALTPAIGMLASYLTFLASAPDSHIVRKHREPLAHSVTEQARCIWEAWEASSDAPDSDALAAWDERLKAGAINPGTSADLAVASAFVAALVHPRLSDVRIPGLAWNVLNNRPTLTRLSG
jgi:triphosphoribosyl-dephospho-CoA synthase